MAATLGAEGEIDLLDFTAELTIYTSSSCLIGRPFREALTPEFSRKYFELEVGTDAIGYLNSQVNIEAFIGVIYIFSFSASILILDKSPHGLEEFKTILNGNILWVTPQQLLSTLALYAGVGLFHFLMRRQFFALTFEGKGGILLEFLFFVSFALVLIKSVLMAGILQVFSFLVIPALIGRLFFRETAKVLMTGWLVGVAVSKRSRVLLDAADLVTVLLLDAAAQLLDATPEARPPLRQRTLQRLTSAIEPVRGVGRRP